MPKKRSKTQSCFDTTPNNPPIAVSFPVNKSKYDTRIFKTILTKEEIIKRQISDELRSELRADFELKGSVDNEKKVG